MEEQNPQILLSWKAPLRAYKKRAGVILRFYIAVALLLSVVVLLFGDKILIVPILTLFFLFYVLTITPPPIVENRITLFGIDSAGITLRWETLSHFYYTTKFGFTILTVVSHLPISYHLFLIVPADVKSQVTHLLSEHLVFMEKPHRGITDRMVDWLSNLVPDDSSEEALERGHQKPVASTLGHQIVSPTQ